MKPPPPPDGIDSLKRRRSTSLSPSLTRNKSPDIFSSNFPVAQNMKERQVAFSDNVISHSPPLSPSSDDNAQIDEENEDDKKEVGRGNDRRQTFREQLESHCDEFLSENISNSSQSSNGHRTKSSLSAETPNMNPSSDHTNSPTIGYNHSDKSVKWHSSKIRKTNSSPYDESAISTEFKDNVEISPRKKSLQSIFPNRGKDRSFDDTQKDSYEHRTGKQNNVNMHSEPTEQNTKRPDASRIVSQNSSPHNHQKDQDQSDPYNYVIESPKNEPNETNESKASSHRKNILYREEGEEGEGIDIEGISVRKRNMVRQT